ncbi:MAG: glycosyltransferase family 9 protein, partial [Pseudonocardia sp.]|nr:glycosyltransferase family 9 protein [Pseudonocardia sp.]
APSGPDRSYATPLDGVTRIAVLRSNALGDYLMATPALAALRGAYPQAWVVLVGARWHAAFLDGRPGPVDEVAVLPQVAGLAGQPPGAPPAAELDGFLSALRARRFDLALQLHGGGGASNPLVAEFGARCTAGLRADGAPALDRWAPYRYYQPETERFLEATALVGADGPARLPRLTVLAAEHEQAARLLPGDGPWVALHPGATDPRRRWPAERFAAVADQLVADGVRPVLVGAADERPVADAVLAAARCAPLDLTGATDLGGLAGVLARCALVVADDSGPLHLAHAVGTPIVGLYWCGNAINAAPARRATARPLLSWTVLCPECGTDCTPAGHPHRVGEGCEHRPSFLTQIPVAEVLDEARDLLGIGAPPAGTPR